MLIAEQASVVHAILSVAHSRPGHPCFIFPDEGHTVNYDQTIKAALRVAGLLDDNAVAVDDIVFIFLSTGLDAYAGLLGAMLLGAIPSFMPKPSARQDAGKYWRDHAAILERTAPCVILTDQSTYASIIASGIIDGSAVRLIRVDSDAVALPLDNVVPRNPDDLALLQHSSGTTGLKKGVMLNNAAILAQIAAYSESLAITDNDIVATWLPTYHDMGLITSTLMPLTLGLTTIVLDPFHWVANPVTLLQAITAYRATFVWQPNFAYEHLVRTVEANRHGIDLSSVRGFINCSEPCLAASMTRFADHFAAMGVRPHQLLNSYAMAETVFAVTQTPIGTEPQKFIAAEAALRNERHARPPQDHESSVAILSSGRVIAGMDLVIIREDGSVCADCETGEIVVTGACLFDGYFRQPEHTAERITPSGFSTRDMGFRAGGEIYVLGRIDDMMIVHGRNYYAGEIEALVGSIVGVKAGRAVALKLFNAKSGSADVVVVAERDQNVELNAALPNEIKCRVYEDMGLLLFGARIVEPGWLSKTMSGKIDRKQNLARYISESGGQLPDAPWGGFL